MRLGVLAAISLLLVGPIATAQDAQDAQDARVVLVEPGASLEAAVLAALEPWGVALVAVPAASPGAEMPGSSEAARVIAEQHDASAVVWVSSTDGGHALWVYDVADDRVSARALATAPPFDEPSAAAIALSVKTLLRHSHVAPEAERWAAAAERFGDPALPEEVSDAPPPAVVEPGPGAAPPAVLEAPRLLFLRTSLGARFLHTDPGSVEPRLSLGVLARPFEGELVGLALDLASGPGVGIGDARFDGRLVDGEAFVTVVLRTSSRVPFGLAAELGGGLSVALLDGVLVDNAAPIDVWRVNGALRGAVVADYAIGPAFRIGLRAAATWLGRRQRYLVNGEPVLRVRDLAVEASLYLEAGLL